MFAIVKTGGKQYRVAPNEKITVEKIEGEAGSKVTLDNVLFLQNDGAEPTFGDPIVKGATVEAEIVKTYKNKNVIFCDFCVLWTHHQTYAHAADTVHAQTCVHTFSLQIHKIP